MLDSTVVLVEFLKSQLHMAYLHAQCALARHGAARGIMRMCSPSHNKVPTTTVKYSSTLLINSPIRFRLKVCDSINTDI